MKTAFYRGVNVIRAISEYFCNMMCASLTLLKKLQKRQGHVRCMKFAVYLLLLSIQEFFSNNIWTSSFVVVLCPWYLNSCHASSFLPKSIIAKICSPACLFNSSGFACPQIWLLSFVSPASKPFEHQQPIGVKSKPYSYSWLRVWFTTLPGSKI